MSEGTILISSRDQLGFYYWAPQSTYPNAGLLCWEWSMAFGPILSAVLASLGGACINSIALGTRFIEPDA